MPKARVRTPLAKLHKHWKRASPEERQAFLDKIGSRLPTAEACLERQESSSLIANGRYLLPQTVTRIEAILRTRGIGPADLVAEIGFPGEALAFTRALTRQSSLRLSIIAALSTWLEDHDAPQKR